MDYRGNGVRRAACYGGADEDDLRKVWVWDVLLGTASHPHRVLMTTKRNDTYKAASD